MAYKPSPMRIAGTIIRFTFYTLIAFLFLLLIWRVYFSTRIPANIDRLIINDRLAEAYAEHGDDLYMFKQNQDIITREDRNRGYFSVVDFVFIPDAKQLQVVFRYNKATLEKVAADYGLSEVPSPGDDIFDLTIVKTTDLTPDDTSDNSNAANLKKERIFPSEIKSDTTLLYCYTRLVFDNIDPGDAVGVFFDIYYEGDVDYNIEAYGTLLLYDARMSKLPVKLSSGDRRRLADAAGR